MIRIKIDGAHAVVEAPDAVLRELDRYFAVEIPHAKFNRRWNQAIRFGHWDGKAHFFSRATGRLPAGLVPMILELYDEDLVSVENSGGYPRAFVAKKLQLVDTLELHGIKLSDFQREAIRRAVAVGHGIQKMATNSGKTEVAAGIIYVLDLPTLYLIHRKDLLHQVADRIEERTGIKCGKVGDGLFDVRKVTVGMVQSLPKVVKGNMKFYDPFKVLIMDECQHGSATTWYKVALAMNAPFKYALSGTPWTGDDLKDLRLVSCFGTEVLADIRNKELIKSGWSATPTIHIWPSPYRANLWPWQMAVDHMIVQNSEYNERVVSVVKDQWRKGLTTLVLVNRTPHGLRLYRRMLGEGIDCKYLTGSTPSDYRKKMLEKFRAGKLGVIIATPIFDEGVDVPAIRCLVLAGGGKAPITLLQRVGRALRRKKGENVAEIHDFFHQGNPHLEHHSEERIKIYESEEFDIKRHDVGELEKV